MFCDEALNAVEAVAAGERPADGRIADHYATCPNCASALESARALERMLQQRLVPTPSAQFTSRTLTRVRRARWRSEQALDIGFNLAIAVVILAIVAGGWMVLNRSGLNVVSKDAVDLLASGLVTFAHQVAPSLPLYLGATALLVTAIGIWWWAEKDAAL
jgi:anti-sigma factor RsiW